MVSKQSSGKASQASRAGTAATSGNRAWLPVVLAWLVPGAGHWYLKRHRQAAVLLAAILGMYLCGLLMQGRMFVPSYGDLFTTVMTFGGFIGDTMNGSLYLLTVAFGYDQGTMPGAVHDYGTKFLVCSGLLNLLAVVDVYESVYGRKVNA